MRQGSPREYRTWASYFSAVTGLHALAFDAREQGIPNLAADAKRQINTVKRMDVTWSTEGRQAPSASSSSAWLVDLV